MAKLNLKITPTALLIILIAQNCSGYLKLWTSKGSLRDKFNHHEHVSGCQNLLPAFIRNTQAAKTDQCLILFSEENCEGDEYKIVPGFYSHLFSFADRTVSFKPCRANRFGIEYSEPEAVFSYEGMQNPPGVSNDPDDYELCSMPLEKISSTCQNLHWGFQLWGIESVDTSKCILFFPEENCRGQESEIPVGHTNTSDANSPLRNPVKSHRTCFSEEILPKNHVKFYSSPNFTEIIDDVELQPGCNKKFYLAMKTVHSMETPACVKLFQTFDCSGSFIEIIPASNPLSSPQNLIFPFKGEAVKSLMLCNEPSENNQKNIFEHLQGVMEQVWSVFWEPIQHLFEKAAPAPKSKNQFEILLNTPQ